MQRLLSLAEKSLSLKAGFAFSIAYQMRRATPMQSLPSSWQVCSAFWAFWCLLWSCSALTSSSFSSLSQPLPCSQGLPFWRDPAPTWRISSWTKTCTLQSHYWPRLFCPCTSLWLQRAICGRSSSLWLNSTASSTSSAKQAFQSPKSSGSALQPGRQSQAGSSEFILLIKRN